ncbi:VanZ family protein [Terrimonas rubra]|uniref:VanZ family protein n=1 Tax=Terrimonas rubra TaxID=1035890 RepID=A0ABW6A1J7_9BACT
MKYLLPAIAWLILSVILLTLPGSQFPSSNWLSAIAFDKWVHIGMFAMMVFLWCWGITRFSARPKQKLKQIFVWVFILSCAYGIGMEYVQENLVIHRSFDVGDIIADIVGALCGLGYAWYRFIKK